ncbi:MAG: Nif3-like dinuclear metal center hexameric protein [Candidatus Heimdallarchaeota archaeon]
MSAMKDLVKVLDSMRKNQTGIILGYEWHEKSRSKLDKTIIASHLTRKVIATAIQSKTCFIVTIYPPSCIQSFGDSIDKTKMEILKSLIDNKIAVYSLGSDWLYTEDGGFNYFLQMIDFPYAKALKINISKHAKQLQGIPYCIGERDKKIAFKDLISVLHELIGEEVIYLGYNQATIQRMAIFTEIKNKGIISEITRNKNIDGIITGDISYDALLTAQTYKIPLVILERRNIENIILGKIRRILMEDVSKDLLDLKIIKQEKIGNTFSK